MTELCLVQDKSQDFAVTWEFLHRRMEEAMQIHSLLQSSGEVSTVAREAVLATFTTVSDGLRKTSQLDIRGNFTAIYHYCCIIVATFNMAVKQSLSGVIHCKRT